MPVFVDHQENVFTKSRKNYLAATFHSWNPCVLSAFRVAEPRDVMMTPSRGRGDFNFFPSHPIFHVLGAGLAQLQVRRATLLPSRPQLRQPSVQVSQPTTERRLDWPSLSCAPPGVEKPLSRGLCNVLARNKSGRLFRGVFCYGGAVCKNSNSCNI